MIISNYILITEFDYTWYSTVQLFIGDNCTTWQAFLLDNLHFLCLIFLCPRCRLWPACSGSIMFSRCPFYCCLVPLTVAVGQRAVRADKSIPVPTSTRLQAVESIPVQKWNSPQGEQVHYKDAAAGVSSDCWRSSAL